MEKKQNIIFKNRKDAGENLAEKVQGDVVVSLLRGGIIVGNEIAKKLQIPNYPLVVAKITAVFPYSPELAIGAICSDFVYKDKEIIQTLNITDSQINKQVSIAKKKEYWYTNKYNLGRYNYAKLLKHKKVIIADDGIATGSTSKAAMQYLKFLRAKKIILAVPVAPREFDPEGFDEIVVLHKERFFSAVGQFYDEFPEVKDDLIIKTLKHENNKAQKQLHNN